TPCNVFEAGWRALDIAAAWLFASVRRVSSPAPTPRRPAVEGELLWSPPKALTSAATITRYMLWLRQQRGLRFDTYPELWRWSVNDLEGFWSSIWDFFDVRGHRPAAQA